MTRPAHYNTTDFTIPAFSSAKGSTWSVTNIVALTGVLISAITFSFLLWKKFQSLVAWWSPPPDTMSEMEMGNHAPVSPQPSAPSVHSGADTVASRDSDHEELASNTTYPARTTGSDDGQRMSNAGPPSEIHGGSSGRPMTEACLSSNGFQEAQTLRLLERASFPLRQAQEEASQESEDRAVTVRRTMTA